MESYSSLHFFCLCIKMCLLLSKLSRLLFNSRILKKNIPQNISLVGSLNRTKKIRLLWSFLVCLTSSPGLLKGSLYLHAIPQSRSVRNPLFNYLQQSYRSLHIKHVHFSKSQHVYTTKLRALKSNIIHRPPCFCR